MNSRLRFGLLTVTTLIAVAATLSLGRWQLSRADQKEAIRSRMEQQAALAPLNGQFLATLADPVSVLQRRVVIRGRWEPKHIVFLDNRQMNAKSGFYVLTPLRLEENDRVVLVQRGWVGRDFMDPSK